MPDDAIEPAALAFCIDHYNPHCSLHTLPHSVPVQLYYFPPLRTPLLMAAPLLVTPLRATARRLIPRISRSASTMSEPIISYHKKVSSAQGVVDNLTGGMYPCSFTPCPIRHPSHQLTVLTAIGNTPLIKLSTLSAQTQCTILGKAEFQNPGGSVKDRAALYLILAAEQSSQLKPGGTVVEGTAGNTGIGLAHVCRARGYKLVIYMPNTQSQGKVDLLRLLGAEVYPVPAVPFEDNMNYNWQAKRHAERVAEEDPEKGAVWTNQFDNTANRQAHVEMTGPEIWGADWRGSGCFCGGDGDGRDVGGGD